MTTKLGGNVEVHNGDHDGSIVLNSTYHDEGTVYKFGLEFESSTTKTVREGKKQLNNQLTN